MTSATSNQIGGPEPQINGGVAQRNLAALRPVGSMGDLAGAQRLTHRLPQLAREMNRQDEQYGRGPHARRISPPDAESTGGDRSRS